MKDVVLFVAIAAAMAAAGLLFTPVTMAQIDAGAIDGADHSVSQPPVPDDGPAIELPDLPWIPRWAERIGLWAVTILVAVRFVLRRVAARTKNTVDDKALGILDWCYKQLSRIGIIRRRE